MKSLVVLKFSTIIFFNNVIIIHMNIFLVLLILSTLWIENFWKNNYYEVKELLQIYLLYSELYCGCQCICPGLCQNSNDYKLISSFQNHFSSININK